MNKKSIIILLGLGAGLLIAMAVILICFDTFPLQDPSTIPPSIQTKLLFPTHFLVYSALLKSYGIDWSTNGSTYYLMNSSKRLSYSDLIYPLFADSSILIIAYGPNSAESGWRFTLLPSYTTVDILNIASLDLIKRFRFWGYIKSTCIDDRALYMQRQDGSIGRMSLAF